MTTAAARTDSCHLNTVEDYLGLTKDERYKASSQHFPAWLLREPIEFPAHHPTYGWACLVHGCEGTPNSTTSVLLCARHRKQFSHLEQGTNLDEFVRGATPIQAQSFGRALARRGGCKVCGTNREAHQHGYCLAHAKMRRLA